MSSGKVIDVTARMGRRALVILNPRASRAPRSAEALTRELLAAGLVPEIHFLQGSTPVRDLILRHRSRADIIVVAGGDGTLNSAADALVRCDRPVGILPFGTANDLARGLGIPADVRGAVEALARGVPRPIDLGSVNGRLFFNAASIGMGVHVTRHLDRASKRRLGILAYMKAFLHALSAGGPYHATIMGRDFVHEGWTVQIVVGNGPFYGGGMTLHEQTTLDDSSLHIQSLEFRHWLEWFAHAPLLWLGRGRWSPRVWTVDVDEVKILTRKPRPVTTDGEITARTPAVFRLVPRALEVLVPDVAGARHGLQDAATMTPPLVTT